MKHIPVDEIETWLAQNAAELADDGFSTAVMRRVQAEDAAQRPVIEAGRALTQLSARESSQRRATRWRVAGTAFGALLAVGVMGWVGGLPTELAPPQTLALLFGLCCAAWWLTDGAALEA
jgi:hypothetical protein